jgi:hypothetical protein
MEYIIYAHILRGEVYQVGDFCSVALWMPPGRNMDDMWTVLRSGMWRLWYKLSVEGRGRFFSEFIPLLHHTKYVLRKRVGVMVERTYWGSEMLRVGTWCTLGRGQRPGEGDTRAS